MPSIGHGRRGPHEAGRHGNYPRRDRAVTAAIVTQNDHRMVSRNRIDHSGKRGPADNKGGPLCPPPQGDGQPALGGLGLSRQFKPPGLLARLEGGRVGLGI